MRCRRQPGVPCISGCGRALGADPSAKYARLSQADRRAIVEILRTPNATCRRPSPLSSPNLERRETEGPHERLVDRSQHARSNERAGERGQRVDLALADVDQDRARAHSSDRPPPHRTARPDDVARWRGLSSMATGRPRNVRPRRIDQPDAWRRNEDHNADDSYTAGSLKRNIAWMNP